MIKTMLFYMALLIVQVECQNLQVNKLVAKILSQFHDYNLIIHTDNATSQNISVFKNDLFNALQGILVLNYDAKRFFNRPVGYKFINIVLLTNIFRFEQFSKIRFNFEYNDVILFLSSVNVSEVIVGSNIKILPFWQQQGLDSAGSLLVLDLSSSDLYNVCFYCGPMTNVLRRISFDNVRDYLNDFSNFHGHYFKIGYMPYLPFFWCKEAPNTGCTVAGSEGRLLQVLNETLNFQYSLENFEDYVGGEWRAMVDAVHYKRLDWAIGGISSSPERGQITDLTKSIHTEVYTVLYHSSPNNKWKLWKQILTPFELSLWLCICGILFFVTFLLKIVPDHLMNNSSTSIFKFFELAIRGLVEQPIMRIPVKSMTKRFLLISWWYTAIIIATAYRSKLASSLINPFNVQPKSILQLLSDGYRFQVNSEDWTVLKENLEGSVGLEHANTDILKKTNDDLDICGSVQLAVTHKVAVIDEATTLQYEVIENCRSLLDPEDFSNLRVIEKNVFPSYHVWPLQLGAPYRHKFSALIENLHSSGILRRWYNLVSKKQLPVSNHYNVRNPAAALTISTMTAPIIILSIGLTLATILFLCELLYFTLNDLIKFYKKHNWA